MSTSFITALATLTSWMTLPLSADSGSVCSHPVRPEHWGGEKQTQTADQFVNRTEPTSLELVLPFRAVGNNDIAYLSA